MSSLTGCRIGNLLLENGAKPLVVPDIGTFFNKDLALAFEVIDSLVDSGAQVIKGELLHDPEICMKSEALISYPESNKVVRSENYRDLIERKFIALDQYKRLLDKITELKVPCIMSVYDFKGAQFGFEPQM